MASSSFVRSGALAAVLVAVAVSTPAIFDLLYPFGTPLQEWPGRTEYATLASLQDSEITIELWNDQKNQKKSSYYTAIYGRGPHAHLLKGIETVILRPKFQEATNRFELDDSILYILSEDGLLLSLTDQKPLDDKTTDDKRQKMTAHVNLVKDFSNGRPLSGAFTPDGQALYVADTVLGLLRLNFTDNDNVDGTPMTNNKVEIVLNSLLDRPELQAKLNPQQDQHDEHYVYNSKFFYVDDVAIGPQSGKVYFSEATSIRPEIMGRRPPDFEYASKADMMLGGPGRGRVWCYDPQTDELELLVEPVRFANGISVVETTTTAKEQNFVVFAESFGPRVWKYDLTSQSLTALMDRSELLGYPDGVACRENDNPQSGETTTKTTCYVVMPGSIVLPHKILASLPSWLEWTMRHLLLLIPRQIAPALQPVGLVLQLDIDDAGKVTKKYYLDPNGQDISFLYGVTMGPMDGTKTKLYLGSVNNDYIGALTLAETI